MDDCAIARQFRAQLLQFLIEIIGIFDANSPICVLAARA
jgi:hypothetical protein